MVYYRWTGEIGLVKSEKPLPRLDRSGVKVLNTAFTVGMARLVAFGAVGRIEIHGSFFGISTADDFHAFVLKNGVTGISVVTAGCLVAPSRFAKLRPHETIYRPSIHTAVIRGAHKDPSLTRHLGIDAEDCRFARHR